MAILNFLMDFVVLYGASCFFQEKVSLVRIGAGSFFGAVSSCVVFVLFGFWLRGWQLLVHLFINPVMTRIVFGKQTWKQFLKRMAVIYMNTAFLGGVVQVFYVNVFHSKLFLPAAAAGSICLFAAGRQIVKKRRTEQFSYKVVLYRQEEKWELKGFYDSGNFLTDPYLKKPVSLLCAARSEKIVPASMPKRIIPFSSLGKPAGMVEAVTMDKMEILTGDIRFSIKEPVIAISKETLFEGRSFDLILNPMLFEDGKEKKCL